LVHGFGNEIIGPGFQGLNPVLFLRKRGHQDHRDWFGFFVVLQAAADLKPVDLGHHHIQEDHVRGVFRDPAQSFFPLGGLQEVIVLWGK
jgi:hypothetical protein